MAAFDRWVLAGKLIEMGWKEVDAPNGERGIYLEPPTDLLKNMPKSFYVHDAVALQGLLGEPVPEDDND